MNTDIVSIAIIPLRYFYFSAITPYHEEEKNTQGCTDTRETGTPNAAGVDEASGGTGP